MKQFLLVGLFGAVGAMARFGVSAWMLRTFGDGFPWGTLAVNVAGCSLIGALFQLEQSLHFASHEWRVALAAGFLGGLTTFSTFGLETVRLFELGRPTTALASVLANVLAGLASVMAGRIMVQWWVGSG